MTMMKQNVTTPLALRINIIQERLPTMNRDSNKKITDLPSLSTVPNAGCVAGEGR